jgi:hypothetical protein
VTYSVVMFKATRGGTTLKKGLEWVHAVEFANNCCDYARIFGSAMATGVAFLIFTDERAAEVSGKGIVYLSCNREESQVLYQAGSY